MSTNTETKYQIQTRDQNDNLHTAWTADGIADQNEFESAAEARVAVRELRAHGDSWVECEYRLVGPRGVESAEMDDGAWQYAIDWQLRLLGLADASNGRSAVVANFDDEGLVALSDVEDYCRGELPEDVLDVLKWIDADQSQDEIRAELASELRG